MTERVLRLARWTRERLLPNRLSASLRPLYWRILSLAAGRRGVAVRFPDGRRYRVEPRLFAWQLEHYEDLVVAELMHAVGPSTVAYDIGAHVGLISMMLASKVAPPGGRVYAFEPAPANVALLRRHLSSNRLEDRVTVLPVLVGDTWRASVDFVCRPREFTANSLAYAIEGGETAQVPMVTVDRLVADGQIAAPAVVKIDVEGFEGAVLRGAREVLIAHRPTVVCAMHPEPLQMLGETTTEIVRWMHELGYRACDLQHRPVLTPEFQEIVFVG